MRTDNNQKPDLQTGQLAGKESNFAPGALSRKMVNSCSARDNRRCPSCPYTMLCLVRGSKPSRPRRSESRIGQPDLFPVERVKLLNQSPEVLNKERIFNEKPKTSYEQKLQKEAKGIKGQTC